MPFVTPERTLSSRTWSIATWSLPVVVQLVLAVLMASMWLLGKLPIFSTDANFGGERAWLLTATAIAVLCSGLTAAALSLVASRSPKCQGLAISFAGSAAIVLAGACLYAFLIYR